MKCKKLLSTLLAMAVSVSSFAALTITANAETTAKKTMNFGSGVISVRDNIYYGYNTEKSTASKWRVLSKNGNTTDGDTVSFSDGTNPVSADNVLFVISENDFGARVFDSNQNRNWKGSNVARVWCNGTEDGQFYKMAGITDTEKAAILQTSKSDAAYSAYWAAENILENDKVFYLSAKEAETYFNSKNDRLFTVGGRDVDWWLRSPRNSYGECGSCVDSLGYCQDADPKFSFFNSRPAFNLNPESVLFTSAADFGSGEVENYNGNEWKLTLKDSTRSGFTARSLIITENVVTVAYQNAVANENVSCVITDENQTEIKYYSTAEVTEASGTIDFTIPRVGHTDRMFVFSEQVNGANKTNLAGELKEVTIPSSITVNVNDAAMGSVTISPDKPFKEGSVTLTAIAKEGYKFVGFISDDVKIYTNGNEGIFTMPDKDATVTATFEPLTVATHKITVISNYPQMGTASASVAVAETGDVVTLSNTPEYGNEFVEYISGDVDVENGKFMMLDKDVTVIAKFKANAEFKDNTETPVQVQKNPDNTALLRFMWGIEMADGAYIKNIGAYIIPWDLFEEGSMSSPSMVIIKEPDIKNGDTFSADHIGIPFEKYNTEYCAIPFVNGTLFTEAMIKGSVNE